MAPDEAVLRKWIREAQANMTLRPLTPGQLEVVQKMSASAEAKATPDSSRLLLEGIKKASGLIMQLLRASDVPEAVRAVLQEILEALDGTGPPAETEAEGKVPTIPESLASIKRTQVKMLGQMPGMQANLEKLLALRTPSPAQVEARIATKIRTAMRSLDTETRPDHEDIYTAATRHHIAAEIARAKKV